MTTCNMFAAENFANYNLQIPVELNLIEGQIDRLTNGFGFSTTKTAAVLFAGRDIPIPTLFISKTQISNEEFVLLYET